MASKRNYTWYLFPLNEHTNRVITQSTDEIGASFHENVECADGKYRPLWEVDGYWVISHLKSCGSEIKFLVFSKEGNGQVRKFEPKKKK